MYGAWLHELCALTQHAGLAENVLDHRLSTRTVILGPVLRFLYWNMNYHIEHHKLIGRGSWISGSRGSFSVSWA